MSMCLWVCVYSLLPTPTSYWHIKVRFPTRNQNTGYIEHNTQWDPLVILMEVR